MSRKVTLTDGPTPSERRAFRVELTGTRRRVTHSCTIAAQDRAEARDSALREWFGPGVFWDVEDDRGRVVEQKLVKRHGKERFLETPLTRWGKLVVREVRRGG